MSQVDDYSLGNLSFPAARARLNNLFAAIRASNSGATPPTNAAGGMLWLDTSVTPAVLRQRSGDNTTWLRLSTPFPVPIDLGGTGATTAAAARTALGATATGVAVFTAADAAAARTATAAQPVSIAADGVGQVVALAVPNNTALVLPAGGTWEFWFQGLTNTGTPSGQGAGVTAGGTTVADANSGIHWICRAKRIS